MAICHFVPQHKFDPSFCSTDIVILSRITSNMPKTILPPSVRKCYEHLFLADTAFDISAPICILISGDL